MNKYIYILLIGLLSTACDDDDSSVTNVPSVWEQSHLQLFALKGPVCKVVETARAILDEEDTEEDIRSESRFDTSGRLTYYNPTGVYPEATVRWIGVSSMSYTYEYDREGRMVKVVTNEIGEAPRTYMLTYGNHKTYVPLIFNFGPFDFFLVQGLEGIESTDGKVNYRFNGTSASYTNKTAFEETEVVYEYSLGSQYPNRQTATSKRNNQLLETVTIDYTFSADGSLVSTDKKVVEGDKGEQEQVEQTTISYVRNKLLLVSSIKTITLNETYEWGYIYNSDFLPLGVVMKYNGETLDEEESYSYSSPDTFGNWTESRESLSSIVDWTHSSGSLKVYRTLSYM